MDKITFYISILFSILITLTQIHTANARGERWVIKTALDHFVVQSRGGGYFINRQQVDLNAFNQLKDFVDNKLAVLESGKENDDEDACSKPDEEPDLKITRIKTGQKSKQIAIYINERFLVMNRGCSSISGDGIFSLPIHRSWYIGPKIIKIDLGPERRLEFNNSSKFVEYRQQEVREDALSEGKPVKLLTNGSVIPDWDKINLFEERLKSIRISGRRHLSYSKDRSHFTLITNGRRYTFYEIRDKGLVWALKLPDKPFLVLSQSLSWGEFDLSHVKDPRSDIISILRNSEKQEGQRITALRKLDNYWNPPFKKILFAIFEDEEEPLRLRRQIAELLIQNPTSQNKKILLSVLVNTEEKPLREYISKRLSILYPQGQAILTTDDGFTVTEKINVWRGLQ